MVSPDVAVARSWPSMERSAPRWISACVAAWAAAGIAAPAFGAFVDPLASPALTSSHPSVEPMLAVSRTPAGVVAVGARGVIIASDPAIRAWSQARVPVQSDLAAVHFIDRNNGWACGHDGVILHSADGGRTWTKQLDGVLARHAFETYYESRIAAGDKSVAAALDQIKLNFDQGPTLPWLGVWFVDRDKGFVVGSFGDIAMTSDGGMTWSPWLEHVDNPDYLELDAIAQVGDQLYAVGEQGTVYVFDSAQQRLVARRTGYTGNLFGLTGNKDLLLVFGLRGTILRSVDQGKTWSKASTSSLATLMSGTMLANGGIVLVGTDGEILVSNDQGRTFQTESEHVDMPASDVVDAGGGHLVVSGLEGIRDVRQ